jgi:ABC-type antimicrobial peptide transport system permease subunit
MSKFALRHMKQNQKRSLYTIIGIVLSVAMITAVSGFVFSAQVSLQSLLKEAQGDWHVAVLDVTTEQADSILADPMVQSGYTEKYDGVINVLFRLANPNKGLEQVVDIASRGGAADRSVRFHLELLGAEGYMISTSMMILYAIGAALGLIIMAGSIIVIANAFAISTGERVRQFGILKSTGATSEQIRMSVLFEGIMLSFIGIPLGILMGLGLQFAGIWIANTLTSGIENADAPTMLFQTVISVSAILISVITSFITVLLSAWFPARKVSKISAIDAIRMSGEVKIKSRSLKTSWLTKKIFGFEGTLAAKSLKRSRRKYRATVISLVVSIVFVLVSASFGNMLFSTIEILFPNISADEASQMQGQAALIMNIHLLAMIFVYGFIGMLSMIGITSVINTIFTNMRLRTQEFAVLKSVGMTADGLRKMLNLESFLYGLKSLLIGLPLGMGLSYALYYLFSMFVSFDFRVPWTAIGVCVLAIMAITFMTMHYAARQIKGDSIVDAIRMVNV